MEVGCHQSPHLSPKLRTKTDVTPFLLIIYKLRSCDDFWPLRSKVSHGRRIDSIMTRIPGRRGSVP